MNLQQPGALVWLLPLGGAILVLYLLKMRRRDVRVPASFLWPAKTEEVRANALFQRLRLNWLLFLQLLILSLVTMALARPQTKQSGLAGEITVFVIDASASMGATDVSPTRFDRAQQLAIDSIRAAKAGDRFAVIEAGPTPRVVASLSGDAHRTTSSVVGMKRFDSESDMGEALRLASALVGGYDGARIVLLSDGCFEPVTNFSRGKAAVIYQQIGTKSSNLAVSALGTAETPKGRQLFVGVKNYGLVDMQATVTLFADGNPISSEKIEAKQGLQWGKTIQVPTTGKVYEARVESDRDLLASDNYGVALADPGSVLRVLLVSQDDPFLERALALDPRVTLDKATAVPSDTSIYDIVVFDGVTEQPVKARGVLTFGGAGETSPVVLKGRGKSPAFVSEAKTPLMNGVSFDNLFQQSSFVVAPKGSAEVVATTTEGPLVVQRKSSALNQVYVSFEPLKSDFPLQVSFPIFIANCLDFLGGKEAANFLAVRAGSIFPLTGAGQATLVDPAGAAHNYNFKNNSSVVRDIAVVGKYSLRYNQRQVPLYAYLRSDRESKIEPAKDISLQGGRVQAQQSPTRFADFWRPLILLSLLVLAGEWWLFARRS